MKNPAYEMESIVDINYRIVKISTSVRQRIFLVSEASKLQYNYNVYHIIRYPTLIVYVYMFKPKASVLFITIQKAVINSAQHALLNSLVAMVAV